MKKMLSFLLTFTLVLSMGINTFASINVTDEGDIASYLGTKSSTGSTSPILTQTNGCYGKAINDKVISVSGFATNDYVYPIAGVEEVTENYYVIEFDYLIPTSGNSEIRFFTSDGNYIVGGIQAGNFFKEKWYKIVVYVDYTTSPNPTGYFFANGSQIKTYTATTMTSEVGKKNAAGDAVNSFKMVFVNVSSTNEVAKIDNFKAYGTNTKPDAAKMTKYNAPIGGPLSISGTTVTTQTVVTVNSLKATYPEYDFVAFADNSCTAELPATTALTAGNALAITDPEGSIEVYTVAVEGLQTLLNGNATANGFSPLGGLSVATADGSMGKNADDKVLRITRTKTDDQTLQQEGLKEVNTDYYVIKFNYMPKTDANLLLNTTKGNAFATAINNDYVYKNKWNSILVYVDYTDLKAGTDTNAKSYLYINGVAYTDEEGFKDLDKDPYNNYGKPRSDGNIRSMRMLLAPVSKEADITTVSADIDDLYMYTTNEKPDGIAETTMPTLSSLDVESAKFTKDVLTIKDGATSSLLTVSNGAELALAKDAIGTPASNIAEANYAFVTEGNKYKAYEISKLSGNADGGVATATLTNAAAGSVVFVAEYTEADKLVGFKFTEAEECGTITTPEYQIKDENSNFVKAFAFSNVGGMEPLIGVLNLLY